MTTNYNSICLKRGSTIKNSDYLGKSGEITIDTDKQIPVIHDGITIGGHPLSRYSDNWIINGSFNVWQRGTSQTTTGYGSADRWYTYLVGSSVGDVTRSAFTIGQTDVPGNPEFYCSINITSSGASDVSLVAVFQRIEDLKEHSGQTAVISFWAKADAVRSMNVHFRQYFGAGGSPSTTLVVLPHYNPILTTEWRKYFVVVDIPSVSGKILGTDGNDGLWLMLAFSSGSTYSSAYGGLGLQTGTFNIAEVKVEKGTVATDVIHLNRSIEYIQCYRYYEKGNLRGPIAAYSTTYVRFSPVYYKVTKRIPPSSITVTNLSTLGIDGTIGSLYAPNSYDHGFAPVYRWTGATAGTAGTGSFDWEADAEI